MFLFFLLLLCFDVNFSSARTSQHTDIGSDYVIWRIGAENDIKTSSSPGALLIGGGTDPIEGFSWQIGLANRGDYLILRASGDDAYNEWIMEISVAQSTPLNSVTTILCKNKNASFSSEVLDHIRNAEAIFFAGGDQVNAY
jgi:cyanophycinase